MAVLPIVLWPDPRLSDVCAPVGAADDLAGLIADMFETLYAAKGRGLAAPQVGVMKRLFVVDVTWKEGTPDPRVFINPTVVSTSHTTATMDEQCLSIPGLPMAVDRPERAELAWETASRAPVSVRFSDVEARILLHELDHLNGRVILDHQPAGRRQALESQYAS